MEEKLKEIIEKAREENLRLEEKVGILRNKINFCSTHKFEEWMIEFAKMHVTEALKQASEKDTMTPRDDVHELDMNADWMEVDKKSILTAYSLDNIV
jgi:hypothetical protein